MHVIQLCPPALTVYKTFCGTFMRLHDGRYIYIYIYIYIIGIPIQKGLFKVPIGLKIIGFLM